MTSFHRIGHVSPENVVFFLIVDLTINGYGELMRALCPGWLNIIVACTGWFAGVPILVINGDQCLFMPIYAH